MGVNKLSAKVFLKVKYSFEEFDLSAIGSIQMKFKFLFFFTTGGKWGCKISLNKTN